MARALNPVPGTIESQLQTCPRPRMFSGAKFTSALPFLGRFCEPAVLMQCGFDVLLSEDPGMSR